MKNLQFRTIFLIVIVLDFSVSSTNIDVRNLIGIKCIDKLDRYLHNLDGGQVASISIERKQPKDKDPDFDWNNYYDYDIMIHYLNHLYLNYSTNVASKRIGLTYENNPIILVKIENNPDNPAIWIDGGIHGNDWSTPTSILYIINEFVTNYDKLPDYIRNINWYFVPLVNPDGYQFTRRRRSRLTRKNRRISKLCPITNEGVDLNHNFGNWRNDAPCSDDYSGPSPFSEPESKAVRDTLNEPNHKWVVYLTFRSIGGQILYPPNRVEEMRIIGEQLAKAIQIENNSTYRVESNINRNGTENWAINSEIFKYAYAIALNDLGKSGHLFPKKQIQANAKDALVLVKTLAKIIGNQTII